MNKLIKSWYLFEKIDFEIENTFFFLKKAKAYYYKFIIYVFQKEKKS